MPCRRDGNPVDSAGAGRQLRGGGSGEWSRVKRRAAGWSAPHWKTWL